MVFFITALRALAACLITNAHYTGVYPTDLIANGGLLGDVIFFAVSGYCLVNIKNSFAKWYSKRLIRVYLPLLLVTVFYILTGAYRISEDKTAVWWFLYPTYYHFASAIMILYIPYFIIIKNRFTREHLPAVMLAVLVLYILVYIFLYDKTYYHIDMVWEHMVKFLYFESMLLGSYYRINAATVRSGRWFIWLLAVLAASGAYIFSKLAFSRIAAISSFQIFNQFALFIALFCIFRLFLCLSDRMERMPLVCRRAICFVSDITLEIYLVQYVLIDLIRYHMGFPFNWVAITGAILVSAELVHLLTKPIVDWLSERIDVSMRCIENRNCN